MSVLLTGASMACWCSWIFDVVHVILYVRLPMQLWVGLVQTSQLVSEALALRSISTKLADLRRLVGPSKRRWWTWRTIHPVKPALYGQNTAIKRFREKPSWYTALRLGLLRACLRDSWKLKLCVHGFGTRACLDWCKRTVSVLYFVLCLCDVFESHVLESLRVSVPISRLAVTCRIEICPLCEWVGVDGWISVPLRMYGTYVVNPVDLSIVGAKQAINRYHLAKAAGPCQSNLPRLSAKVGIRNSKSPSSSRPQNKNPKRVRYGKSGKHGVHSQYVYVYPVSWGGTVSLTRERPCGCDGLWRWSKMWPWNVVTWSCLSRIQWRKESVTRPSFMQSSHRIDMAGWHSEWVTVQSGSGALFWWLHDDGDGLGPVGVKWERSQGFADSRTMKSPAAGGCSGVTTASCNWQGP